MDIDKFWALIEQTKTESQNNGERQAQLLIQHLENISEDDIVRYDEIFRQLMEQANHFYLWNAAIIISCFCSDDGFDDFRAWLIGQGQSVFKKALDNPESLADVIRISDYESDEGFPYREELLYVAEIAYENKTGHNIPPSRFPYVPVHGEQKNISDWLTLYPILARTYWSRC